MQQKADILLFIGANFEYNGGIVSSKIFEYLQSGKPILPIFVCKDSDVYHIIEKSCGFCPVIQDYNDLMSILSQLNHENANILLPVLKHYEFFEQLLEAYGNFVKDC